MVLSRPELLSPRSKLLPLSGTLKCDSSERDFVDECASIRSKTGEDADTMIPSTREMLMQTFATAANSFESCHSRSIPPLRPLSLPIP